MTILIIILVIIIIFIYLKKNTENFKNLYGMDYRDQHRYFQCCNEYGCSSSMCKNILLKNKSNLIYIGYLTHDDTYIKLYKRLDQNTGKYKYFAGFKNTDTDTDKKDLHFKEIENKNYIYDGDIINIDGINYKVIIHDTNFYHEHNKWTKPNLYIQPKLNKLYLRPKIPMVRRGTRIHDYRYPQVGSYFDTNHWYTNTDYEYHPIEYNNYEKIGVIKKNNSDFYVIYRQGKSRNRWNYYIKKDDLFLKLNNVEKEIYENDEITYDGKVYKFTEE